MAIPRLLVLILGIATEIAALAMAIRHAPGAAPWPWLWVVIIAAGVTLFLMRRPGWSAAAFVIALIVFASRLVWPPSPIHTQNAHNSNLVDVDLAILAVDAPTLLRAVAAVLCLFTLVAIGMAADPAGRGPRRLAAVVGIGALAIGVAVPAGYGLEQLTRHRISADGGQLETFDHNLDDVGSAQVGSHKAWTRAQLNGATAAGDLVIGLEQRTEPKEESSPKTDAVVAYSATDGALLWRYTVASGPTEEWIDVVRVDPLSETVLVQVKSAVVGISFEGDLTYTRSLPTPDEHRRWEAVSDKLANTGPVVDTASVVVLSDQSHGFAVGVDVATGKTLWHYAPLPVDCSLATATAPEPSQVVYLLTGGESPCPTSLVRFDGSERSWVQELKAPPGLVDARSGSYSVGVPQSMEQPATIAVPDRDRALAAPVWFGRRQGEASNEQPVYQFNSSGEVTATLADRDPALHGSLIQLPISSSNSPGAPLATGVWQYHERGQERTGWVTLDADLQPTRTTRLKGSAQTRPIGPLVAAVPRYVDGEPTTLHSPDPEFITRETIHVDQLDGCDDTFDALTSDGHTLVARCSDTIMVRPLT